MSTGQFVLAVAVVAAIGFGLWRLYVDGRFRGTHRVPGGPPTEEHDDRWAWDGEKGDRATLLQFSTKFCAPCRATRHTLVDVAQLVPGVVHVEVDAEHHLDLVRELGITRTPTTLILDPAGREVTRAAGAPKRGEVLATLAEVV
jgi:thiol-disulfide isomerase/thioredoxin